FLGRALPALDVALLAARDGELLGRHVPRDDRARAYRGAGADGYGRHQRGIRADEGAVPDHRTVLVGAVVVAGDGARADVHAAAYGRVADVGQVVGLAAGADLGLLDL